MIDSGATCNVISQYDLSPGAEIRKCDVKLTIHNSRNITALGRAKIKLVNPKNFTKYRGDLIIVLDHRLLLIGSL